MASGEGVDVRELPGRIEALLDRLDAADPVLAQAGEELVGALVQLYGEGLARIVAAFDGSPELRRVAEDDLVAHLLLLHDLHPDDVDTRVQRALDRVRPYLGSHAGGVEYLGVSDGVARLRLEGNCDGCAGSTATVSNAVERAVLEAAPEVVRVEVAGVVAPSTSPLLQIGMRCPDGLVEAVT